MIKNYDCYKTLKKTAKVNNLYIYDRGILNTPYAADLALLNNMDVSDDDSKAINAELTNLANIDIFPNTPNGISFIDFDNFKFTRLFYWFYKHRVYSADGKHLYNILQLAKIRYITYTRKSVYDEFDIESDIELNCGYSAPVTDIDFVTDIDLD